MFGRVPAVRRVATTDLMEVRNLLISLGSFLKCEPAQKRVVVASKKLGQYHLFVCRPGFIRWEDKNFYLHNMLAQPRGGRASTYYGVFANIFRKRNMSQNRRSGDQVTQHPSRPDHQREDHLFASQTHADAKVTVCFSLLIIIFIN
jgi:hypothetical protein